MIMPMSRPADMSLRSRLSDACVWRGDRYDEMVYPDDSQWWREPRLLADIATGLTQLFEDQQPTVVLGIESRGTMLGSLVAMKLGLGLLEVRKNRRPMTDSDAWVHATTPPDYRDRHLSLGFRRGLMTSGDRVLFVDDWIESGSQATTARALVGQVGAHWVGAAVIVDALSGGLERRELEVRSLVMGHDLRM